MEYYRKLLSDDWDGYYDTNSEGMCEEDQEFVTGVGKSTEPKPKCCRTRGALNVWFYGCNGWIVWR